METKLTKREMQIVQVLAWGAAKKEVPDYLPGTNISIFTVDNHLRNIYQKLHIQSLNALSAWYFVNEIGAGIEQCPLPLRQKITSITLLIIVLSTMITSQLDAIRPNARMGNSMQRSMCRARLGRGRTYELEI